MKAGVYICDGNEEAKKALIKQLAVDVIERSAKTGQSIITILASSAAATVFLSQKSGLPTDELVDSLENFFHTHLAIIIAQSISKN
jgi:hypothetical protein